MQFEFSDEQAQFRDVVQRFCRDKSPAQTVRRIMETESGFDRDLWRALCGQLGVAGLHVAESSGGAGFGAVELGIVMEEFGRSLMPAPYLASVLATSALAELGESDARDALMADIAAADTIATLALDPQHGDPICRSVSADGGRLNGSVSAVLDARHADVVLIITADDARPTLHAANAGSDGLTSRPLRTMDRTRRLAELRFDGVVADRLGSLTNRQLKHVYDTALVALANESAGAAQALFDSTVEYVGMRVQFGRKIGSFQAIKHRLADLLVDVELARVAAYQAAAALAADEAVSATASLAKFTTSDACMNAAREAIQLRGGIGFTWENDTHLWYRRAKSSEVFLGTPAFHRERMIQEMTA
ncbi:MAG: acyl-CoA dehydrogenase family protein [Pseudomonadales bacterium]